VDIRTESDKRLARLLKYRKSGGLGKKYVESAIINNIESGLTKVEAAKRKLQLSKLRARLQKAKK